MFERKLLTVSPCIPFLFLALDLLVSDMPLCLALYRVCSLEEFGQGGTDIADGDSDH